MVKNAARAAGDLLYAQFTADQGMLGVALFPPGFCYATKKLVIVALSRRMDLSTKA